MKNLKFKPALLYSAVVVFAATSCSGPAAEDAATAEATAVDSTVVETEMVDEKAVHDADLILIHEDRFHHQHLAELQNAESHEGHDHAEGEGHGKKGIELENENFAAQSSDIEAYMASRDFEPIEVVETTTLMIPLEETETLMAFDKKANFEGQVTVVSNSSTGEVSHIVFTGKHHKDEYDVSAGLTGHEARKLRRDLKHMSHKGQVFLYEEESNIVYLMDSKNLVTGEEVTEEQIDNMTISAVLWKDSKHHASGEGHGHDHSEE